ncbi:MAG: hypothetical protein M2R45_04360 [Verrucomicrobia subdivision 3 bacterium]|nr:hypothetical protein [Limisphaerales bacterium]MCS1416064.1 hypothetical protein [Limisphaerales bacterium]
MFTDLEFEIEVVRDEFWFSVTGGQRRSVAIEWKDGFMVWSECMGGICGNVCVKFRCPERGGCGTAFLLVM